MVFLLDIGKQALGMATAHICGLLIAILIHQYSEGISECAWYLVVYVIDTSLGVWLGIKLHDSLVRYARGCYEHSIQGLISPPIVPQLSTKEERIMNVLANSGYYGIPINYHHWTIQVVAWMACVVVARIGCGAVAFSSAPLLTHIAAFIDLTFGNHDVLMLFFVMTVGPLLLNTVQLLLQDSALMHHGVS